MSFLSWVGSLAAWFTTTSVLPWAGALAAVVASLTVDPKSWVKYPLKSIGRMLRVAVVWIVVAWLLQAALPGKPGGGHGPGGPGSGAGGQGSGSGGGTGEGTSAPPAVVTEAIGQFPGGTPANVIVVVKFVPSPANSAVAQDFACDLLRRGPENRMTKAEIRAARMEDFDRVLVQQLREVSPPPASERPVVSVRRSPFPGENVLRRVGDKVRAVLPAATVVYEE